MNRPFTQGQKKFEKLNNYDKQEYHLQCMDKAKNFVISFENPSACIPAKFDSELDKKVSENRKIVRAVAHSVLWCAKQCIALRGSGSENPNCETGNPGNFVSLLKFISVYSDDIKQHLCNPKASNAKMLSPEIQNEIIHVI